MSEQIEYPCTANLFLQFGTDDAGNVVIGIVARVPEWNLSVQGRTLEEVSDRLKISLESTQKISDMSEERIIGGTGGDATDIKPGDMVEYAGSLYEVADTKLRRPGMVPIYDEPPSRHKIDYINAENLTCPNLPTNAQDFCLDRNDLVSVDGEGEYQITSIRVRGGLPEITVNGIPGSIAISRIGLLED